MTFSSDQAHVSTSQRGCPIPQLSYDSLLPKSLTNTRDHVSVTVCESTHGTRSDQMESSAPISSSVRIHSQLELDRHDPPHLILKEFNQASEQTNSTHTLDTGYQVGFCGHPGTLSQDHSLEVHSNRSPFHRTPTSSHSTNQTAELVDTSLTEASTLRQGILDSQPCTPVITDYTDSEHSPLCCLCGIPCCHCQTQCFPPKSTPNRCNACAAHILSAFCSSRWLSSSLCGWRLNRWRRRRIPNENLLVLSVIQLLCGFAAIILSSVALTKAVFLYQMATGMWAGFLMLITGTQGLIASRRPIVCTLTGLLTLCVVVTIAACLLICVSVAGTIEDGFLDPVTPRSQHQTIKLTYSFHPSPGGLQKSDQFYSLTYHGMPDNRTVSRLSWGAIHQLYSDRTASHFVHSTQDTHLRTCQVILHVLLLLVGILESSVSLSTCVLCCRYVCSRSGRFGSNQNPFATRTNIVSLNAATANQAASVLRSGELSQFIGSGNFLLAVSAGTQSDPTDPSFNLLHQNSAGVEPCLHPSVAPFLPQFNRPALILTQAGTGAMAWTAARAAATLVNRDSINANEPLEGASSTNPPSNEPINTSNSRYSRFRQLFHPHTDRRNGRRTQAGRPQLLFTSLSTLNNRASSNHQNDRGANSLPMVTGLPPCPPGSTLIYVMPSPTNDSPPMIFPPFPPVYSSLQRRPSTLNTPRRSTHGDRRSVHTRRTSAGGTARSRSNRSSECTQRDRSITRQYLSRIFTWRRDPQYRSRHVTRARTRHPSPSRTSNSALLCAGGNRLLQPVLIIEDPDIFQGNSANPPPYCTINQQEESHNS